MASGRGKRSIFGDIGSVIAIVMGISDHSQLGKIQVRQKDIIANEMTNHKSLLKLENATTEAIRKLHMDEAMIELHLGLHEACESVVGQLKELNKLTIESVSGQTSVPMLSMEQVRDSFERLLQKLQENKEKTIYSNPVDLLRAPKHVLIAEDRLRIVLAIPVVKMVSRIATINGVTPMEVVAKNGEVYKIDVREVAVIQHPRPIVGYSGMNMEDILACSRDHDPWICPGPRLRELRPTSCITALYVGDGKAIAETCNVVKTMLSNKMSPVVELGTTVETRYKISITEECN